MDKISRFSFFGMGLALFLMTMPGCAEKKKEEPIESSTRTAAPKPLSFSGGENVAKLETAHHAAELVVDRFLQAMLRGENKTLRSMLTPTARKQGEEKGIPFSPSPSPTASYSIRTTIPKENIGAYVVSTLTDIDEQGRRESAEIIWVVARTGEGWRIAGAAVALFEGQEKTVINFEDPDAARRAIAEAELRDIGRRRNPTKIAAQPYFGDVPPSVPQNGPLFIR